MRVFNKIRGWWRLKSGKCPWCGAALSNNLQGSVLIACAIEYCRYGHYAEKWLLDMRFGRFHHRTGRFSSDGKWNWWAADLFESLGVIPTVDQLP